jgi:hypothetical protein
MKITKRTKDVCEQVTDFRQHLNAYAEASEAVKEIIS